MRRKIAFLLAVFLSFSLAACGTENSTSVPKTDAPADSQEETSAAKENDAPVLEETQTTGSNVLIAYFSVPEDVETTDAIAGASIVVRDGEKLGNTEYVAELIQNTVGGDLFRIKTVKEYPLDHDPLVDQAADEQDADARPELAAHVENFGQYEYVFLGFPNWWGNAPRVILTFLEQYDLTDKVVIPFCTSGGSTIEESIAELKQSCAGAEWKDGYTADAGDEEEIREWLTEIGELESEEEEPEPGEDEIEKSEEEVSGGLLVAYFSWSGTSEKIAQNIIAQTGADSFRIERQIPYSTDYTETAYGDAKDEADNNARPPIKDPLVSVEKYDKIIICYPIWWHTAPMTVGTFLESYDLTGKTIYPVSQSASMDRTQYEQSVEFIRECAKGASVDDGLFTRDSAAIERYVDGIVNKQ